MSKLWLPWMRQENVIGGRSGSSLLGAINEKACLGTLEKLMINLSFDTQLKRHVVTDGSWLRAPTSSSVFLNL